MRYHPWRDARRRHRLNIAFVDLPTNIRGRTCGDRIEINRRLVTSAERRCTLAHELVHHERGAVPVDPILAAREEITVERTAARRLIALDHLVDVLCWSRHIGEVADELWVDVPMLQALVDSLTPDERAWIEGCLEEWAA